MEELLTKDELKKELKRTAGIDVKDSILGVYQKLQLITPPKVVSNHKGRKGRTGLYDRSVIETIKKIKKLTGEGYTLQNIKAKFANEVIPAKQKELKDKIKKKIIEYLDGETVLMREEIDDISHAIHLGWGTAIPPDISNMDEYFKKLLGLKKKE